MKKRISFITFMLLNLMLLLVYENVNAQNQINPFEELADFYTGQDKKLPESFQHLSTLEVKTSITKDIKEGIRIHFPASVSTVIDTNVIGIYGPRSPVRRLIVTKININDDNYYTIDFSQGASVDPEFIINRNIDGKAVFIDKFFAIEIIVPGDGFLYISGHTNTMYNKRRKFRIKDGKFIEVQQPYYHVGLETINTEHITLYSDTLYTEKVSDIPAKSKITVLINKGDYYLIKSPIGLTGWIKIPRWSWKSPIKFLFFRGD
ncbi:hypothetical protein ACFL40_00010 [candidate division KSB1 bacterium]